jgi:hypothetical protein
MSHRSTRSNHSFSLHNKSNINYSEIEIMQKEANMFTKKYEHEKKYEIIKKKLLNKKIKYCEYFINKQNKNIFIKIIFILLN